MALGFTSHYKAGDANFGSLTHPVHNSESESSETSGQVSGLIYSPSNYGECDSCEFSNPVSVDYTQYSAVIADGSSSETAGSIAYSGGSVASFSSGGGGACASFSGGGGGGSGCSCASFTC